MRGLWWSSVLIGSLLGGIVGAGLMFGLTQAFGGSSGSSHSATSGTGVRVSDTRPGSDGTAAKNGVDAAGVFDQVRPSVVTVNTTTIRRRSRNDGEGTGIVLDNNGRILTNSHVIEGASRIQVVLNNGRSLDATVLATDPDNDLAVIGVNAPSGTLHPAKLGDSSKLYVGQPVLAIGNPLGYEASLTEGIISGLDRTFQDTQGPQMNHLIQSDAAINPGNSGGPLINGRGEVIGINALLDNADGSDTFSGLGFAVPINLAQTVIQQAAKVNR